MTRRAANFLFTVGALQQITACAGGTVEVEANGTVTSDVDVGTSADGELEAEVDATGDGDGDGDTGTTVASDGSAEAEAEAAGDGDGDGDGDGGRTEPPACRPSSLVPVPYPGHEPQQPTQELGFLLAEMNTQEVQTLCADLVSVFQVNLPMNWAQDPGIYLIARVPEFSESNPPPADGVPLYFHHHGNGGVVGQRGDWYDHLAREVVERGGVFVSVGGDRNSGAAHRAFINACSLRWLSSEADWDANPDTPGGSELLNGNVILSGHSNGGAAAQITSKWLLQEGWKNAEDPEYDLALCGTVQLAPGALEDNRVGFDSSPGVANKIARPLLVLEGSTDNDVPGGSLENYSSWAPEELYRSDDAGKYAIWVYDAEHDSFGGGRPVIDGARDPTYQHLIGTTVSSTFLGAFLDHMIYDMLGGEATLLGDLSETEIEGFWWGMHPQYVGEPLVFVSYHLEQRSSNSGRRIVVDTMCRQPDSGSPNDCEVEPDPTSPTTSEGGSFSASGWATKALRIGLPHELGSMASRPVALVMRATWRPGEPGQEPPSLTWGTGHLADRLPDAEYLSVRVSNVDDVLDPDLCDRADGDASDTDFLIVFEGPGGLTPATPVRISDWGRLAPQDFFKPDSPLGQPIPCRPSQFLRRIRIPLEVALGGLFAPEEIESVSFVFGAEGMPQQGSIFLDSLEFH